ncbi:hypothetical protein MTO96_039587, partial [Rhipicephalus appendiculatus]
GEECTVTLKDLSTGAAETLISLQNPIAAAVFVDYLEVRHRYSIAVARFAEEFVSPRGPSMTVLLDADWALTECQHRVGGARNFARLRDWTGLVTIAVTFPDHSTAAVQIAAETEAHSWGLETACSLVELYHSMTVVAADVK